MKPVLRLIGCLLLITYIPAITLWPVEFFMGS